MRKLLALFSLSPSDEPVRHRHALAARAHLLPIFSVIEPLAVVLAAVEPRLPLSIEAKPLDLAWQMMSVGRSVDSFIGGVSRLIVLSGRAPHLADERRQRDALLRCANDHFLPDRARLKEIRHRGCVHLLEMPGAGAVGRGGEHPGRRGQRCPEHLRKRSVFEFSLCLSRACLGKNEQSSI